MQIKWHYGIRMNCSILTRTDLHRLRLMHAQAFCRGVMQARAQAIKFTPVKKKNTHRKMLK